MAYFFPLYPQGGKMSQLNPTSCIGKTILHGIYIYIYVYSILRVLSFLLLLQVYVWHTHTSEPDLTNEKKKMSNNLVQLQLSTYSIFQLYFMCMLAWTNIKNVRVRKISCSITLICSHKCMMTLLHHSSQRNVTLSLWSYIDLIQGVWPQGQQAVAMVMPILYGNSYSPNDSNTKVIGHGLMVDL